MERALRRQGRGTGKDRGLFGQQGKLVRQPGRALQTGDFARPGATGELCEGKKDGTIAGRIDRRAQADRARQHGPAEATRGRQGKEHRRPDPACIPRGPAVGATGRGARQVTHMGRRVRRLRIGQPTAGKPDPKENVPGNRQHASPDPETPGRGLRPHQRSVQRALGSNGRRQQHLRDEMVSLDRGRFGSLLKTRPP